MSRTTSHFEPSFIALSILIILLVILMWCVRVAPSCLPVEPATISLPSPKKTGGVSVETALAARRSIRAYTKQPLTMSGVKNHTWTDYEAGLASENLMLEAVALGLGSAVTGGIDVGAEKDALKFTGNEQVIVVIPVHPAK